MGIDLSLLPINRGRTLALPELSMGRRRLPHRRKPDQPFLPGLNEVLYRPRRYGIVEISTGLYPSHNVHEI